jgi:hypothetical protein
MNIPDFLVSVFRATEAWEGFVNAGVLLSGVIDCGGSISTTGCTEGGSKAVVCCGPFTGE